MANDFHFCEFHQWVFVCLLFSQKRIRSSARLEGKILMQSVECWHGAPMNLLLSHLRFHRYQFQQFVLSNTCSLDWIPTACESMIGSSTGQQHVQMVVSDGTFQLHSHRLLLEAWLQQSIFVYSTLEFCHCQCHHSSSVWTLWYLPVFCPVHKVL